MSRLKYSDLVFVSQNRSKLQEYSIVLGIPDLKWSDIQVSESQHVDLHVLIQEKALAIKTKLPKIPFFVEHTGLIIEGWKGLPGGLTRQFMERVGCNGICRMMKDFGEHERSAIARAVIGLYIPQTDQITVCQGDSFGTIALEPRGKASFGVFGWDPIFIPEGDSRTYGEMTLLEKNATSMRTKVVHELSKYLDKHFEL